MGIPGLGLWSSGLEWSRAERTEQNSDWCQENAEFPLRALSGLVQFLFMAMAIAAICAKVIRSNKTFNHKV